MLQIMFKYLIRVFMFGLFFSYAYAVSSTEVSQDLNGLIRQINQVNSDLNSKQKQQQNLSRAIDDSDEAIDQSQNLLKQLKQKRNLDMKQLDEIESVLPQLTDATKAVRDNIKTAISKIYQQLRLLESSDNGSIFNGNNNLQNDRKKKYLVTILQAEQQKYVELQSKLDELNTLNDKINSELNNVDKQLGITTKRKSQLQQDKDDKLQMVSSLQQKISKEQQQLANLKQQQLELNKLLQNLQAMEVAEKKAQIAKQSTKQIAVGKPDTRYEDNSPFLSRKLSKPVEGGVVIAGFGAVHDGVANNGVLFKASNSAIHAISSGKVLFSGTLPGFGQMVVVDNGDNYVSIYGGVLPKVNKGQQLTANQVIASSGVIANQPMGGVYFELRHFGKPVNPSKLQ